MIISFDIYISPLNFATTLMSSHSTDNVQNIITNFIKNPMAHLNLEILCDLIECADET